VSCCCYILYSLTADEKPEEYFPASDISEPAGSQSNQRQRITIESVHDDGKALQSDSSKHILIELGTYPLWRLIKDSSIANRRHNNGQKVHEFLGMAGFYETYRYLGRHLWVPIEPKKKPETFKYGIG
jgi:hypothetical protein